MSGGFIPVKPSRMPVVAVAAAGACREVSLAATWVVDFNARAEEQVEVPQPLPSAANPL